LTAGASSAVYNVGTGTPHSVRSVIDTVSRVVGQSVRWEPAPRRPGDPAALYASSDRIQSALGWRPRHPDLDAIVQNAWRWHAAHPEGYKDRAQPV
jgi:UDP-glucose 4-epimerase